VNVPNAITIARLFLVPVFVYLAYEGSDEAQVGAFAVFLVASLSDILDGYLARRSGTITRLGEFLDPLADKILVLAALVVLVEQRTFPVVIALVILVREIAVQLLRNRIVGAGGTLPASVMAKAKTVLQIVMVSWWLLPFEIGVAHWVLLAAALVSTLWSGAEYFINYNRTKEAVG
jgi:CDP-diacylglycerol--glycerol-3-phosphate 3-phosphatidyltransferase